MILSVFYLNNTLKYSAWIPGNLSWLKRNQKIYDTEGIMLPLFEGSSVKYFNPKGDMIECGLVKNGKITRSYIQDQLESSDEVSDFEDDEPFMDYTGEVYNDLPNGKGILKKNGHLEYCGHFLNGKKNGQGKSFLNELGIMHSGEYFDGLFHGFGKYFLPNFEKKYQNHLLFEGNFKYGFPFYGKFFHEGKLVHHGYFKHYSGFFSFLFTDGFYSGSFQNGKRNGYGTLHNIDTRQLLFNGFWKQDKYHGKGILWNKNNSILYEGDWKDGLRSGHGEEFFYTESRYYKYSGEFQKDKKNGYGIQYELNYDLNQIRKIYSGEWKDDIQNGSGMWYFENGILRYEGDIVNGHQQGFGRRYYRDGTLHYEGYLNRDCYEGEGRLFYYDGTICFEGLFKNKNPFRGTFYNFEDGEVYKTREVNGNYYTKAVLIRPEGYGEIYYQGFFKNGLEHGKAISESYRGEFRNGKFHGRGTCTINGYCYKGQFINGNLWNGKDEVKSLFSNEIVFKGSIKDEQYFDGIETLFQEKDYFCEYPIGRRKWNKGQIVNEKEERETIRQNIYIASYLETKNKKLLSKLHKKSYFIYLKEKFNVDGKKDLTKKQLLCLLKKEYKEKEKLLSEETIKLDLFGNEIKQPVLGSDGEIYDESSMKYLFEKNEKNEFINLSYTYDKDNNRIPNFPRMANGKILDGYTKK